ncbi:Elongation factor 1-alpha 2 [Gossypium arboreum]|uniref:Elongation factor 1-alpha 2 n=1 Tax=Gossypium arboreum TaxID=29729 RepID=A0A0B0PX03_GOSAR|nr:Elongation factor 1-alpha 2 [Gossypium arboreum]
MGSSEGDSTFAPRTATGITRGGLPLFLLRTEVEDKAFAAHHNRREEEKPGRCQTRGRPVVGALGGGGGARDGQGQRGVAAEILVARPNLAITGGKGA